MSQKEHTNAEDLDLEGSDADGIVGGRINLDRHGAHTMQSEVARLEAKGYVEESCTTEGTMLINPKTQHRVTVSYS